jgi:hypothetical protein
MAKAKKSESGSDAKQEKQAKLTTKETAAPAKKKSTTPAAAAPASSGAAHAAHAAKAKKPTKPTGAAATNTPMIDTSRAAHSAAAMLVAGLKKSGPANQSNAPKQESAMFKQLKAGLNKPHSTTMSNLLDKSQGPEQTKSHQAFNKQVGHNQTFGADVTRSGVPRRTPG